MPEAHTGRDLAGAKGVLDTDEAIKLNPYKPKTALKP